MNTLIAESDENILQAIDLHNKVGLFSLLQ